MLRPPTQLRSLSPAAVHGQLHAYLSCHYVGLLANTKAEHKLWNAGEKREKAGRCITNLVLIPATNSPPSEASAKVLPGQVARNRLLYTAVRALSSDEEDSRTRGNDALNEKGFAEGDMAVLSVEGQLLCAISLDVTCHVWCHTLSCCHQLLVLLMVVNTG